MQFGGSNLAELWKEWETVVQVYFDSAELEKRAVKTQVAIPLHAAGP